MKRPYYAFALIPALLTVGGCAQLSANDRATLNEAHAMAREAKDLATQAAQDAAGARNSAAASAQAAQAAQMAAERAANAAADRSFQESGKK